MKAEPADREVLMGVIGKLAASPREQDRDLADTLLRIEERRAQRKHCDTCGAGEGYCAYVNACH